MYTRCPACHTVHAVSAAVLAAASGSYRCARCNKVSNALGHLFDELPAPGDRPPGEGDLPVLGLSIDLQAARSPRESGPGDESVVEIERVARRRPGWFLLRAAWIAGAVVVLGYVGIRIAEFQGWPLPGIEDVAARVGLPLRQDDTSFRDLDRIHVVSREMRSHPSQPAKLRLAATIVNRAAQKQAFPVIEVILQDAGGRTLSTRRFEPPDYLVGTDSTAHMTPGAYLPVLLELDDPGEQAVGFELAFR